MSATLPDSYYLLLPFRLVPGHPPVRHGFSRVLGPKVLGRVRGGHRLRHVAVRQRVKSCE